MIPDLIVTILTPFAQLFSNPGWKKLQILFVGSILCQGARRVTSILHVMGLSDDKGFSNFHRFFNRDCYNLLSGARILLKELINLLPKSDPVIIALDDTLERRKGKKIKAKGCYRDAVSSSQGHVVKAFGLKWLSFCLITPLPWSKRPWALPFLTFLQYSKKYDKERNHHHRTTIDYAKIAARLMSKWIKDRSWIFLGDGGFACLSLAKACVQNGGHLISRLRINARLYNFPKEAEPGKRGRKAQKGSRIEAFTQMLEKKDCGWENIEVEWYGGVKRTLKIMTGVNLMHKTNEGVVVIQWVLVKDEDGQNVPLFSTNIEHSPQFIIETFVKRFGIEIMFEEARAHLGMETQRQWTDKAILRCTPLLFGLFSAVCLIALKLKETVELTVQPGIWYLKSTDQATFSDIISFVREHCWRHRILINSAENNETIKLKSTDWLFIIKRLAGSA